ncbi:hypothetical protein [Sphingobium aromaticiconvertens]|uniref:hypothetical protein n=1 Tax=Sphingobium aromaticiconvertens TaxID=365341 RepID=UPI00301B1DF5
MLDLVRPTPYACAMGTLSFTNDSEYPATPSGGRSTAPSILARPIPAGWLAGFVTAWLGSTQFLLWRFLDCAPLWAYPLGIALLALLCIGIHKSMTPHGGPSPATLLISLGTAFLLLMLGGEGRFFYANIDWQVRGAVLRDMGINPWPFVYTARDTPDVLRAPIGMFLWPALAFKAWGSRAADIALLLQNSALLGTLLALGSTLFPTHRARWVALAVVLAFSGLDALGHILMRGGLADHLEGWAGLQYSSTITLAFWVPQHALSGWIGALAFLLWRSDRLSLGGFLALLPLTALLSPLGLIGAMPFAALAGIETLLRRALRPSDIALPALATLISLASLAYLGAADDAVGMRLIAPPPGQWAMFEVLEVLVYLIPLVFLVRTGRFGIATLAVAGLSLLILPFFQIGSSIDLMMRGSITALTILVVMIADALIAPSRVRLWLTVMLLIGSITGLFEIARAVRHSPMPEIQCSFFKAWDQSFSDFPKDSYLAPLARMPAPIRPTHPIHVSAVEPATCWDGHWYHPGEKEI